VVVAFFLAQIFSLQVLQSQNFAERAKKAAEREAVLPAPRGEIYDRNHEDPLATTKTSLTVQIVPGEVPAANLPGELDRLALVLGLDSDLVHRLVPASKYRDFAPISLTRKVSPDQLRPLAERSDEFPGVSWEEVPVRSYASLATLSGVVGYVGDISPDELTLLYNHGYDSRSVVGKSGIEKQYDALLRGTDGTLFRTVDALGRAQVGKQNVTLPIPGKTLILTIDQTVQTLAEKALGSRIGSVVVLRPATGEILALVSYPSYDSASLSGPEASQTFQNLLADPHNPFLDRAVQATYPAASTFKIIMSAAVLGEGVIDPAKQIFSGPEYVLGDRRFKEHDPHGLGWVNMARALALSANIYFYTVGVEYLGIDRISRSARSFGLGQPTGIDLPGEVSGLVPDPAWKEAALHSPWLGGDTANLSIGQGYLQVTPLQMADAIALVANEGTVYRPHLLKAVITPGSGVIDEPAPEVLFHSSIAPSVWKPLQEALRGVITTGTAAAVVTTTAVEIAGKTGTGEDGEKGSSNHSWFVAYAPYNDPDPEKRIVVAVQVERTNTWEWWAPKAANLIFQGMFARQNYDEALRAMGPRWG
jgi:penicillin-binding protein 2